MLEYIVYSKLIIINFIYKIHLLNKLFFNLIRFTHKSLNLDIKTFHHRNQKWWFQIARSLIFYLFTYNLNICKKTINNNLLIFFTTGIRDDGSRLPEETCSVHRAAQKFVGTKPVCQWGRNLRQGQELAGWNWSLKFEHSILLCFWNFEL